MINQNSNLPNNSFRVIGAMSGTSLDGLDLCLCLFTIQNERWNYRIEKAITTKYDNKLQEKLSTAINISGRELTKLDYEYGKWIGIQIKDFLKDTEFQPDFIASHGHTIFHKPSEGYTLQIGKGSAIAAEVGIPCISDFRSSDVCRNGQGAPLVPIGDRLLFSEYDICLNLGGFSNISFEKVNQRLAFDIGPCNIALNTLAQILGLKFDEDGELGKRGNINLPLLNELNSFEFYSQTGPKSLGREWVEEIFIPAVEKANIRVEDKLRTLYEHITDQISRITNQVVGKNMIITGGGAHNSFLIHLLRNKSNHLIVIPDDQTIDFKEALIFAFLGVLYTIKQPSSLSSVTGANRDSISGCLYY